MHDGSNGVLDEASVKPLLRPSSLRAGVRSMPPKARERLTRPEDPASTEVIMIF
jgi:hypothetical protein